MANTKGYKAFKPGMICEANGNRKVYAENTTYEETGASSCCHEGVMHFCENPFDCLNYYPLVNENGEFSEFAEVEALGEVLSDKDKRATSKLHIGAKLSFKNFIKAGIDVLIETTKPGKIKSKLKNADGYSAKIGSSGDYAKIGSSGYSAQIGSSGDYAQIGSSGDYAQIGSSGYSAQIGSSGDSAKITATGKNSVVSAIGKNAVVRAALGNWIVLAEYGDWDGEGRPVKCVKTAMVDGEIIKANTWYKLENGEFVEAEA